MADNLINDGRISMSGSGGAAAAGLLSAPVTSHESPANGISDAANEFVDPKKTTVTPEEETSPEEVIGETAENDGAVEEAHAEDDAPADGETPAESDTTEENAEAVTDEPETSEETEDTADDIEIDPKAEIFTETTVTTAVTTETEKPTQQPNTNGVLITIIIVMGVLLLGLVVLLIVKSVAGGKPKYRPVPVQMPPQGGMGGITQTAAPSAVSPYRIGKIHEQGARGEQQDSFGVSNEELIPSYGLLAVVADGMGGLENGGRVSAAATRSVLNTFLMSQGRLSSKELLVTLLRQAENDVNETLGEENYRKSGTTLAMGYFRGSEFNFLSIGDSRISLFRNGMLMQLNREHTYENKQLIRSVNGEIGVSEALGDPKGSGLVNFLGRGEITAVDMPAAPIKLVPGDKIMLMSDGIYNALSEGELTEALSYPTEQAAAAVRAAVAGKSYTNQDNYTAVIIGYGV